MWKCWNHPCFPMTMCPTVPLRNSPLSHSLGDVVQKRCNTNRVTELVGVSRWVSWRNYKCALHDDSWSPSASRELTERDAGVHRLASPRLARMNHLSSITSLYLDRRRRRRRRRRRWAAPRGTDWRRRRGGAIAAQSSWRRARDIRPNERATDPAGCCCCCGGGGGGHRMRKIESQVSEWVRRSSQLHGRDERRR